VRRRGLGRPPAIWHRRRIGAKHRRRGPVASECENAGSGGWDVWFGVAGGFFCPRACTLCVSRGSIRRRAADGVGFT